MQRDVTIAGNRIVLDDDGTGDAVVCLHAIGHDARDFARLRGRLRDRQRVVAVDWPGQGRSPWDRVAPTARHYAAVVGGVLDALAIESCVLVGNSIGGAAAIAYAAPEPSRVRALILENPGGLAPTDDRLAQTVLATMARFFAAGARRARWFPAAFALYYRTVLQRAPAREARERIATRAYDLAPILEQAWRGFATPGADLRGVASTVRCPVLFAWAARDQVVSLARSLPAIRQFPNARIVRFPAGHSPHLETPDAFEAAVESFLRELPAPAATIRHAL